MVTHLTSLRPAAVRLPPVAPRAPVNRTTAASTKTAAATTPAVSSDPAADFRALFGGSAAAATPATTASSTAVGIKPAASPTVTAPAATTPDPNAAPTVESVFGANPWMDNPTGVAPDGTSYSYNPIYFATLATAQKVAQMVGGTVTQDNEFTKNTPGNPFHQSQSNYMVALPNGGLVNPGLVASFYTHGYPQWMVNQMVTNEVAGATSVGT